MFLEDVSGLEVLSGDEVEALIIAIQSDVEMFQQKTKGD